MKPFVSPWVRCALLMASLSPTFINPAPVYTPLVSLGNDAECEKCQWHLLPGRIVPREAFPYAVHSDLPELFRSNGVLYATLPVLPPFETHADGPLDAAMRTQVNHGYTGLDGSFELFLYHLSLPADGTEPRRIVVYTMNRGMETVVFEPRAAIESAGKMGAEDGPEIRLARRVFTGEFDILEDVAIPPGGGAVLASTEIIAGPPGDSTAGFINGILRAVVKSPGKPKVDVAVVAIPADTAPANMNDVVESLLSVGARSGETSMDLRIPPPQCHVRRVVGVYRNFEWHGEAHLDVTALPENNLAFQMALPAAQARGCEQARQTGDMLLHPPYVHPETIGNYTIEYRVNLTLDNPSPEPATVDVRFGKQDASIGLAWTASLAMPGEDPVRGPVRTGWAGAWTLGDFPDDTRSFLEQPLQLQPGDSREVHLHFHIAGTSSLPFQLRVIREK